MDRHRTHLALIDGYVDQHLAKFEDFYFATYIPKFIANWKAAFKAGENRDYEEAKDFALLHQDLIAEYQDKTAPVEKMRTDLKSAITAVCRAPGATAPSQLRIFAL